LRETTQEEAIKHLEIAWRRDRALQMTLILLDRNEKEDVREKAAECLDDLLTTEEDRERLADVMYSSPLPKTADVTKMRKWAKANGILAAFSERLIADQPSIKKWCDEWASIPEGMFGGFEKKQQMRLLAIQAGAFRLFVEEQGRGDAALLRLHISEEFKGKALGRKILQLWAGRFRSSISNADFPAIASEDGLEEAKARQPRRKKRQSSHAVFLGVAAQKDAIERALESGRRDVAMKYTRELVAWQRGNSQDEHISKTLCDLAQHGKMLGDYCWHLELSRWATREMPTDSWAWAQAGDGFRLVGDYKSALAAFEKAGYLGDSRIALCGRAEVLKDHGQISEALEVYEACAAKFPDDSVPLCGRASALASAGFLPPAVSAYEAVLASFRDCMIAETGLADVLGEIGEHQKSLELFDSLIVRRPNEEAPQCARAKLLRHLGRLEESRAAYEAVIQRIPLSLYARNGRAKVLRDLGKLNDSLVAYEEIIDKFEHHPIAHYGRADVLKKLGRLDEAEAAYRDCIRRMPKNVTGRNGLASVLMAKGQIEAALDILPDTDPASQGEWIGYHLRGVILLAKADVDHAERHFREGLNELPWVKLRPLFRASLAGVKLRQHDYAEATNLVTDIPRGVVFPVAKLFALHAFGMLNNRGEARYAYDQLNAICPPPLESVKEALANRFILERCGPLDETLLYAQEWFAISVAA
jgi:tetratricopeptide (TPR) repeat protein